METIKVAVPSALPGGMDAPLDKHFGHCGVYTIVDIDKGAVSAVSTLDSVPHAQGGCMMSVQHLASHGVNVLLSGGMGMRPLMGFQQAGTEVFFAGDFATVGQAVQAYLDKTLQVFNPDFTCKGH